MRPRIRQAFLWSSAGDVAAKVAVLALTIVAARALDTIEFALFIGLSAVAVLASAVWDAGSSVVITREVAAGRISARQASIEAAKVRARSFAPWLFVFALAVLVLGPKSIPANSVFAFALASLLAGARTVPVALLQAEMRFAAAGAAMGLGRWLAAGAALAAFFTDPADRLGVLGLATAGGEAATLLCGAVLVVMRPARSAEGHGRITLRASVPFAVNTLLGLTYNRFDVLIVAALTSAGQLAAYAPASRFQDALYLLPTAMGAITLPMVASAWQEGAGAGDVQRLLGRLMLGGLVMAVPIAAAACFYAPEIIDAVLGDGYDKAVAPTRILVWFVTFSVIYAPPLAALAAIGRARDTVVVFASTFVVAIAFQVALVPSLGGVGGAIASLARDPFALVVTLVLARRAGLLRSRRGIATFVRRSRRLERIAGESRLHDDRQSLDR